VRKKNASAHPKGPGVWMPLSTLESPAWKALSDGAQRLYLALKAKTDNAHHSAYLSTRDAAAALGRRNRLKIREWYAELEFYGFLVMLSAGCLGSDGRGKAPLWRLTDKGTTRGGFEPATHDFLRWNGSLFDPKPYRDKRGKTESRNGRGFQGGMDGGSSPGMDGVPLNEGGGMDVRAIHEDIGGTDVRAITSINHYGGSPRRLSSSLEMDPQTSLPSNDPRVVALDSKAPRSRNGR
jgi:hypothetical protein